MADETPEKNEEKTAEAQAPEEAAPEAAASDDAASEGAASEKAGSESAASGEAAPRPTKAERRAANAKPRPRTPEERQEARRKKAQVRRAYRTKLKQKRAERRAAEPAREPDQAVRPSSGRRKVRQGIVVSDKADKTIVVRIDVANRHRRYRKVLRTSTTLHAHDEANDANTGDTVRIVESRPISRSKRWRLVEVLERAQ